MSQEIQFTDKDIMCGRCSTAFNNKGNRRFRKTIQLNLPQYTAAHSRHQKSAVILGVVNLLRDEIGARFLKKKAGKFVELSTKECREKVGHALRDMAVQQAAQRSSSTGHGPPKAPETPEPDLLRERSRSVSPTPSCSTTVRNNAEGSHEEEIEIDLLPIDAPLDISLFESFGQLSCFEEDGTTAEMPISFHDEQPQAQDEDIVDALEFLFAPEEVAV